MQDQGQIHQINPIEPKSVLVVSDLADNVNETDLSLFFENYRDSILFIELRARNDFTNKPNSATIIFRDNKEANKARLELNLRKLKGKTVRILWHEKDATLRYGNQFNLYIKNVPKNVSPREYFEFFLQFGDIVSAKLSESEDGEHLGYGYIHYNNNESVQKCIESADDKEIWKGSKIKIEPFQKKNERNFTTNNNSSVFIKNFPSNYDESKIRALFGDLNILWIKISEDEKNRKSACITFDSEDSAIKAKQKNGIVVEGLELFVDSLMNKMDRRRYLSGKIIEHNMQLSHQFRDCNLYIKNLPLELKEDDLRAIFAPFGDIKSLKIKTQIQVTKSKDKFVENSISCGFGYVCFTNSQHAAVALEALNGKTLDQYSGKRPLEIAFFTPKNERKTKQYMSNKINMPMNMMNESYKQNNRQQFQQYNEVQQVQQQDTEKRAEEPDYQVLKSMDDESSKRDYLGEFIFKKIELHELTEMNKLTFDEIGKITGMILGIEDINEIIDICRNKEHLTSRINEALELLKAV